MFAGIFIDLHCPAGMNCNHHKMCHAQLTLMENAVMDMVEI